MTTKELEIKKTEAPIRKAKTSVVQPPCRYTVEELRDRVAESLEDVKAGRVYSMEEVRAMFSRP
jgi:hypothetical protein